MAGYNGWTNWETWNAKLWIDNDEYTQDNAREIVAEYWTGRESGTAAAALEMWHSNIMPDLGASLWMDLLTSAFEAIDFDEIAESIHDDNPEDYPDEEDDEEAEDMACNQCIATMINGTYCHETGCPNKGKVKVDGLWTTPEEWSA